MSIRLMASAWDLDIPSTEKMVLLCLCDFSNDHGVCWPSVSTIAGKCSKSHRTVQAAIQWLRNEGYCSWDETPGRPHRFTLNPRKICTPAESAPPQELHEPPQLLRTTPASSADEPSITTKEPSKSKLRAIPDNWMPAEFAIGTESRKVVDSWPPGELKAQVEQFLAHHGSKNNAFSDPQKAWSSWVLNTRKFGVGRNERTNTLGRHQSPDGLSSTARAAISVFGN